MSDKTDLLFEGDDDIKIAGKKAPEPSPYEEKAKILEQLEEADEDGKTALAKLIGKQAAQKICKCEGDFELLRDVDSSLLINCRLLLLFSITVGSERYLQSNILARIVINSCQVEMDRLCPETFGPEGNYSTALSFYYLAVRGVGSTESEIGKTFALICERPEDKGLCALGTELFAAGTEYILKRSAEFSE